MLEIFPTKGLGQTQASVLEKSISVRFSATPLEKALKEISELTGFVFAYGKDVIHSRKPVTLIASQQSVKTILQTILPKDVTIRVKGNYVILKKTDSGRKKTMDGFVSDKSSGKKISNASVFDPVTLSSAVTDQHGYYQLPVHQTAERNIISINKENFVNTALPVSTDPDSVQETFIQPISDTAKSILADTNETDGFKQNLIRRFQTVESMINQRNIKDSLSRIGQISIIPFIGTNKKLSGQVVNDYSLNLIGGLSKGNEKAELSLGFNINRKTLRGIQVAGFANYVGEESDAVQFAGGFNLVFGSAKRFQFAGIGNFTKENFSGIQLAGLANLNHGKATGVMVSAFGNFNHEVQNGVSVGGAMNHTKESDRELQFAGLYNFSKSGNKTIQGAGLFNIQNFGNSNIQIAGLFNSTQNNDGLMLAPFNFADSSKGIPVGIMSFVKTGVHQLEISYDELQFINLSYRSGVDHFYSLISGGIRSAGSGNPTWSMGYGIGTNLRLGEKTKLNIDLTTSQISKGDFYPFVNLLNRLYIGPEFLIAKKITVGIGPTANLFISHTSGKDFNYFSNIQPYEMYNFSGTQGSELRGWIGIKGLVRFF